VAVLDFSMMTAPRAYLRMSWRMPT